MRRPAHWRSARNRRSATSKSRFQKCARCTGCEGSGASGHLCPTAAQRKHQACCDVPLSSLVTSWQRMHYVATTPARVFGSTLRTRLADQSPNFAGLVLEHAAAAPTSSAPAPCGSVHFRRLCRECTQQHVALSLSSPSDREKTEAYGFRLVQPAALLGSSAAARGCHAAHRGCGGVVRRRAGIGAGTWRTAPSPSCTRCTRCVHGDSTQPAASLLRPGRCSHPSCGGHWEDFACPSPSLWCDVSIMDARRQRSMPQAQVVKGFGSWSHSMQRACGLCCSARACWARVMAAMRSAVRASVSLGWGNRDSQRSHLRSMMLSLSSEAGGGGLPMVAMTRRIMGCMLTGAAAAAASSTCSDFPLSSTPSCVCGASLT